jgi:hypothetical protein
MELPVAGHLDTGEADETAAWHFKRLDYAPAFVSVEPSDHARHCNSLPGRLPRHGADCVICLSRSHPLMPVFRAFGARHPGRRERRVAYRRGRAARPCEIRRPRALCSHGMVGRLPSPGRSSRPARPPTGWPMPASGAPGADHDEQAGRCVTGAGTVLGHVGHRPAPFPRSAAGHSGSGTPAGRAPEQHRPGGNRR